MVSNVSTILNWEIGTNSWIIELKIFKLMKALGDHLVQIPSPHVN